MLIVFHLASVSDQIKPFFHSSKIIAKPTEKYNGLKHAIRDFCRSEEPEASTSGHFLHPNQLDTIFSM